MGYISEVGLCLNKNAMSEFMEKLDNSDSETRNLVNDLLNNPTNHMSDSETGSEFWYWQWLKWYSDYPDVAFIEEALSQMDNNDYLFIRIGEDSDDNEIQGSYWDNPFEMSLTRRIEFEKPGV